MVKPYAVVFSGVPGTSKSIITNYLSYKFSLPVLSSDQIRWEVREDFRVNTIHAPGVMDEFHKRFKERREQALSTGNPIILDGSVDRKWGEYKNQLEKFGYSYFLINMELSRPFMNELFAKTGRQELTTDYLGRYFSDHVRFMSQYSEDVSLSIRDDDFSNRLKLSEDALREFIKN